MRWAVSILFAALALANPVFAKNKQPLDPNKKICRTEIPTGSVMSRTACYTAAQWQEVDNAYQRNVDALNNQRTIAGAQSDPKSMAR